MQTSEAQTFSICMRSIQTCVFAVRVHYNILNLEEIMPLELGEVSFNNFLTVVPVVLKIFLQLWPIL